MLTTNSPCTQVKDSPDAAPFASVVQDHIGWVYACARRHLGDASLADDAVQAVFMALWQKRKHLAANAKPIGGWLLRATRYACNDLRKINRRRDHHERKAAAMRREETRSSDEATESKTEQLLALDAAMQKLSTAERDILVARFFQSHTAGAVAQQWQISEAAAEKRISRAVAKLRGIMARKNTSMDSMALASLLTGGAGTAPSELLGTVLQGITGNAPLSLTATHAARHIAFHTVHIPAIATAAVVAIAVGVAAVVPVLLTARHASKKTSPALTVSAPQAVAAASSAAGNGILTCVAYEMLVQKDFAWAIKTGGKLISGKPGGVQAYNISARVVRALALAQSSGGRIVLGSRLNWLSRPLPIQLGRSNYAPAPTYQTPVGFNLRHTLLRKKVLAQIFTQTDLQWHERTYRNALHLGVKFTRRSNIVYSYNVPIAGASLPYVFMGNLSIQPGRAVVLVRRVMNFQGTRWYSAVVFDVHRYPYRLLPEIYSLTNVVRYIKQGPSGIKLIAAVAAAWGRYSATHPARVPSGGARWTKYLPDGATASLQKISTGAWPLCTWSPVGEPSGEADTFWLGHPIDGVGAGHVSVLFRLELPADEVGVAPGVHGRPKNMFTYDWAGGHAQANTSCVGLDSGPWKIIGTAKPTLDPNRKWFFTYRGYQFDAYAISIQSANPADHMPGQICVDIFVSRRRTRNLADLAIAVGAVNQRGQLVSPHPGRVAYYWGFSRFQTSRAEATNEYADGETIPISPENVKRYVWITRPRHWVTFHGFALQPSPLPSTVYALEQRQIPITKKAADTAMPVINIAANQVTPGGLMVLLAHAMRSGNPADFQDLAYAPTPAERHLLVTESKRAAAQNAYGLWAAARKQFGVAQMREAGLGNFIRKPFTPAFPQHWKIKGAYATPIMPLRAGASWPAKGQPLHALIRKNGQWYLDLDMTSSQLINLEKIWARGNAHVSPRSQVYHTVMQQLQAGKIKDAYALRDALNAALKHFSKPPQ